MLPKSCMISLTVLFTAFYPRPNSRSMEWFPLERAYRPGMDFRMWNETYRDLLNSVARGLGADPETLKNLIEFESGWNPLAYNPSGAVGLIQFMPATLRDMGLLPPSLLSLMPDTGIVSETAKQAIRKYFTETYPTIVSQLSGPVPKYLQRWKPFPTEQSLYMAVFYPAYRSASPDTLFPPKVRTANPGIDTVQNYVDFVKKKSLKRI